MSKRASVTWHATWGRNWSTIGPETVENTADYESASKGRLWRLEA